MTKKQVSERIIQDGKPLSQDKFFWDETSRVFATNEDNLIIDFSGESFCVLRFGSYCHVTTGSDCDFRMDSHNTVKTSWNCNFNGKDDNTFDTGSHCTFDLGCGNSFKTKWNCQFNAKNDNHFDTESYCTYNITYGCTFDAGKECVAIRRDVFEVIILEDTKKIINKE